MENNKIAVGLDIGTTKIVAMIGRKNEYDKIEVVGTGKAKSLGVKRGVVSNITQTIQSIQQAVDEAESVSGVQIDEVVVGIAGQHIRSLHHSDYITRNNADEVINENDIEDLVNQVHKLVMLPGEEIIHVLPQEFKVDSQADIKEPIGMYGGRLEANFHVVVGQVSSIRNIGRCVKSAGLGLSEITLEPLASASAVLSQEEKEAGVALIDIGDGRARHRSTRANAEMGFSRAQMGFSQVFSIYMRYRYRPMPELAYFSPNLYFAKIKYSCTIRKHCSETSAGSTR